MKRRLFIAAVFLLAGAVVNVAVAWGCAVSTKGFGTMSRVADAKKETVLWRRYAADDWVYLHTINQEWLGATVTNAEGFSDERGKLRRVSACDYGWPAHSLRYVTRTAVDDGMAQVEAFGAWQSAWLFERIGRRGPLPLTPRWLGFAVNTIVYGTLLWLLIPGPFTLRRFIRVKRGRCPACAYPVGSSDVCSECGKPLPRRMTVTT